MATPPAELQALLASSKRVFRNVTSSRDLIAVYLSIEQKCLDAPSTLTDSERRLLLDFPDADMETANISAATNLSRAQLIKKAVSNRESLTSEEVVILRDGVWTPSSSREKSRIFDEGNEEAHEKLRIFRTPAYAPNEQEALDIGVMEFLNRVWTVRDDKLRVEAEVALPDAPGWIQDL